ncbi:MAG: aryl-sulfate sulfotransferase, partial [bacterium]
GPNSGEVVWFWNSWDNLIQDVDPAKPNYGVVSENPNRIDINAGGNRSDWLHANSVRYNPTRDEVMISIHNLHEIWIISRKTGKMVYRWGNPQIYKAGAVAQQRLWGQHDARWLPGDWGRVM